MAPMRSGFALLSLPATAARASSQLGRLQPAVLADVGPVEALDPQPVGHVARLVGDPLLVHGIVVARQDAQHLASPRIDADVGADRIHDVDRLGLAQLPGPIDEGPGTMRQRADRAEVVDVGGQLRRHAALEVGGDLHVLAAADGAELLDAGHLRHEAHAARAVDAAVHGRLDQRPQVFLLHRPLVLLEARAAEAVGHGLVLQVALAALVADRAVERVVDEQELHHPLARLLHHGRVGVDDLGGAVLVGGKVVDAHGAGGDRLGAALHLDQAHAAVAGDRQALVVAEARDLDAGLLAGLDQRDAVLDLHGRAIDDQLLGHSRSGSSRSRLVVTPPRPAWP